MVRTVTPKRPLLNQAHFRFVNWPVLLSPQALAVQFHGVTLLMKSGRTSPVAVYHLSSARRLRESRPPPLLIGRAPRRGRSRRFG
jgi:hypothetical protein